MPQYFNQIINFIIYNFQSYFFSFDAGIFIPGYFFWSIVLYVIFYICLAKHITSRKNIKSKVDNRNGGYGLDFKQTRREIVYSVLSSFIFGLTGLFVTLTLGRFFPVYTQIDGVLGYLYLIISVPLLFIAHDTWFYWTHRAMHHPKIFRYAHKLHHLSKETTPFTAISFHPLEAVVEALWSVIPFLIIPFHPIALLIFALIETFHTVFNHLGYESLPKGFTKHPIFGIKTTPTHHGMHHEKVGGNYGLYFTFWDRVMGTEFKDYHQRFESLTTQTNSSKL